MQPSGMNTHETTHADRRMPHNWCYISIWQNSEGKRARKARAIPRIKEREREREIGRFCQCKKVVVIPMKKTDGEILQPHVEWFVLKPDWYMQIRFFLLW